MKGELRKQMSVIINRLDYLLIRDYAAKTNKPICLVLANELEPLLVRLRRDEKENQCQSKHKPLL